MSNKPLGFPFGFFTNDNTPDSGKYFNRTATPPRPYIDVAEAMTVLPLGVRVAGLPINIAGVEYHWKPEWTTEALLDQAPVVRLPNIDETYLPRLSKTPVSNYSDTGIVLSPNGAVYGEAYSYASGTKVVGVLRIKLPIAYANCIMKIEGSINRLGPTELVKFKIGGYWSGGGAFTGGGYKNWWSIDSATWERSLSDLSNVLLRFGYELTDPNDPASTKHPVIYIGNTTTDWGVQAGFFIDKVYCINSALTVNNTKDWEVSVIDDDSSIIANQSTVFLVPTQPISFVDKVLSGCELNFSDLDTKVSVATGYYDIAGTQYNPATMGTPFNIPAPHASLPRIDIITGTQNLISVADSNFKYYVGTPSESAVASTVPVGEILIREILVSVAGVQPSAPDLSGFVTTNTNQNVGGEKNFTNDLSLTNAFLKTNRGIYFYDRSKDSSQPYASVYPDFSFKALESGSFKYGFFSSKLPNTQQLDLDYDRETGIFDFKQRLTVNGSDIALVSEVDANTTALNTKADLVNGTVPANQLPSFVDDVLEFTNLAAFPATGENGKIYIALDTNVTYRWGGSSYVAIGSSLALGETSQTAYRGDRGKTAFDHSQDVTTNPHAVTKTQVGLSNVPNTDFTAAVDLNTAKRSYPSGDETKLEGIATGSTANVKATSAEVITGTDDVKFTTPKTIFDWFANIKNIVVHITARWQFAGIGIGTAGVTNAWLILAASTNAIASFIVTFGASYTGTVEGSIWGETTGKRLKIYRNGIADDFLFKGANPSLVGTGTAVAFIGADGTITRGAGLDEGVTLDSDIITALNAMATARATITPANSKIFRQGESFDNGTFTFFAYADNQVRRW